MDILKNIRTSTLGITGMCGAPWMFVDLMQNELYEGFAPTSMGRIFGIVFITGWLCSVAGLYRLKAAGTGKPGQTILIIQMILLLLAIALNVYTIFQPQIELLLPRAMNPFWVSGFFMPITGIAVMKAKKLHTWRRFTPLIAGLWFPVAILFLPAIFGFSLSTLIISGVYSAISFLLLGFSILTAGISVNKRATLNRQTYV